MKISLVILACLLIGANCWWADELPWCLEPFKYPVTMETTKAQVDVLKYMGTWYEVARMPAPFQPDCICSQALYSFNAEEKYVIVDNSCIERSGKSARALGKAYPMNDHNTKLEVKFNFDPKVVGNYWILEIEPNYNWVVVGEPCRRDAWILSRTRTLDPTTLAARIQTLQSHHYDISKLVFRDAKC